MHKGHGAYTMGRKAGISQSTFTRITAHPQVLARGWSIAWSLPHFHLIPVTIQGVEIGFGDAAARLMTQLLDLLESLREFTVRLSQGGFGLHSGMPNQVDYGKQQVAGLLFERLLIEAVPDFGTQFVHLLFHLVEDTPDIMPVEPYARCLLLKL